MLSRVLGAIGRSLITAGTLILLFVVYELWGTGLQEAHAQKELKKGFAEAKAEQAKRNATSTTSTTTTAPPDQTTTTGLKVEATKLVPADIPLPKNGDPIAQIRIPKIGLTRTVVEGVTLDQLKRGPGHYPTTPLPGQAGNAAIAGHRTTYGQPFHNIDKLKMGDNIFIETLQGKFVYSIDFIRVVGPHDNWVLLPTYRKGDHRLENRLTLTACHPKYSAAQRLIVSGQLIGKPVPFYEGQEEATKKAIGDLADDGSGPGSNGKTIEGGLSGIGASRWPTVLWGLACALIWLVTWLAQTAMRRRLRVRLAASMAGDGGDDDALAAFAAGERRRLPHHTRLSRKERLSTWLPYLIGVPIFMVALYVFFENFGRLLPGNY